MPQVNEFSWCYLYTFYLLLVFMMVFMIQFNSMFLLKSGVKIIHEGSFFLSI